MNTKQIREQLRTQFPTIYQAFLCHLSDEELIAELIRQKKQGIKKTPVAGRRSSNGQALMQEEE